MLPILIVFALLIIGAAQIISAIYVLAGMGWALLALGMVTIAFAMLIARGVANG